MKQIAIIGASSGVGLQTAQKLCADGNRVWGTFNNTIPSFDHENVSFHKFDVLDLQSDLSFLPDKLDGFIYCPGRIDLKPFHRIMLEDFRRDLELQYIGAIRSIQAVYPKLKQSPFAAIVLFSTVAVQNGFNFHSLVSGSKGAIEGLTRALAAEFAPSIRVNCVAPSITQTSLAAKLLSSEERIEANANRHPLRRIGQPGDLANMACFLLSEQSSWITGQIYTVDGGISRIK